MEEFLTEFFTLNKDDRFTKYNEAMADEKTAEKGSEEYFKAFDSMATDNCFDIMTRDRIPSKYEELAADNYDSVEVSKIDLEVYQDNTYTYKVTLDLIKGKDKTETTISGQIGIDDDQKIYNIYVKETGKFIRALEGNSDPAETEAVTEKATEEKATEAATEEATEAATEKATEKATEASKKDKSKDSSKKSTKAAAEDETEAETKAAKKN